MWVGEDEEKGEKQERITAKLNWEQKVAEGKRVIGAVIIWNQTGKGGKWGGGQGFLWHAIDAFHDNQDNESNEDNGQTNH